MKNTVSSFLIGLLCLSHFALQAQVLFEIEGNPVYADEFRYVYKKNSFNNPEAYTKKDIDNYFQLFVNFKLKVYDARQKGLDTLPELKREYESYKQQVRKPYLSDNSVTDQLVKEAYDRLLEEVRAAHILLLIEPDASPEDTLEVYNQLLEIKGKAENGVPFEILAKQYSQDPSAASNGGDLGYFTSMQMVYPFEDAAYNLEPGKISNPVRTRFGYHLIKVYDRRKSEGEIQVAHIMLRFGQFMSGGDSLMLKDKAFEIYEKLQKGYSWEEACKVYSEDNASKNEGGLLRPVKRGNMPPSFGEAAFSLQNEGDFSKPFTTRYGWHIVKLVRKIGIEPFDEIKDYIESRVSGDERAGIGQAALIDRLKKENGFNIKTENVERFLSEKGLAENILLATIGDSSYYSSDVSMDFNGNFDHKASTLYSWLDEQVIKYEEMMLPHKYPEYRFLLSEYQEGILLFQIMSETVWDKAAQDTTGLRNFYNQNKKNYQWNDRMSGWMVESTETSVIERIQNLLEANPNISVDSVRSYLKENSVKLYKIMEGPFEKGTEYTENISFEKGNHLYKDGQLNRLMVFRDKLKAGPKAFNEVKGNVISDYQESLEKEYIATLKSTYKVVVKKKVKKNVFKELTK